MAVRNKQADHGVSVTTIKEQTALRAIAACLPGSYAEKKRAGLMLVCLQLQQKCN